ncbi:TlpA family protein disulfide reductase [Sphingobacteriales bacterium UPWRP_1]|nr:hypothetical protein B6N25_15800 [Sphingobacteriales bacterium TSM_CSS]PSJ74459.1 TlpA family protein disulfide reductase [Sphingobacteriales bacterium UPWRP_1]
MQQITRLFFLLVLTAGFQAVFAQQTTKITVSAPETMALTDKNVYITADATYLGVNPDTIRPKTAGNNALEMQLTLVQPRMVQLHYANRSLNVYTEPADNLQITLAPDSLKNAAFEGKGAVHNRFLQDFYANFTAMYNPTGMNEKIMNTSIDGLEMELFDSRKKQRDFVKNYPDKSSFSADFDLFIQNEITYNYLCYVAGYSIVRANADAKSLTVSRIPQVMLDEITPAVVNNEKAMVNEPYRSFLIYYITYVTSEVNNLNKFKDIGLSLKMKFNQIRQRLSGEPYNYAITKYLYDYCEKADAETVQLLYRYLSSNDEDQRYAKIAAARCADPLKAPVIAEKDKEKDKKNNTKDNDSAGDAAGNITFTTLDGAEMRLKDLRGKVVYVDFWASWCGPCRKQMPFSKELHEKLSSKQKKKVVFLYISIDDNEQAWKDALQKLELTNGTHGWSTGGWNSKVAKFFQISSIPRYMLIDPQGNIVEPNAKRPSDETILDEILKLVK